MKLIDIKQTWLNRRTQTAPWRLNRAKRRLDMEVTKIKCYRHQTPEQPSHTVRRCPFYSPNNDQRGTSSLSCTLICQNQWRVSNHISLNRNKRESVISNTKLIRRLGKCQTKHSYSNGHEVPGAEKHRSYGQHQGQMDYLFKAAIESKANTTPRRTHSWR